MAKKYCESFENKADGYCVSVLEMDNKSVQVGIDIGVDGFYAELSKKELDKLISMLEKAKKAIIKQ